ncbi:MAG: hypothetical protein IJB70_02120, partial [Clostridia bacterium]|nr:hypothetical protein [Clostridia bacterium]
NILSLLDGSIRKYSADTNSRALYEPILEKLGDARTKIEDVYLEGIGTKNGDVNSNVSEKNLIFKSFEKDFDKWVTDGKPNNKVLDVGVTSDALKSIGVKEQKIVWRTGKILKILNDHPNVGVDELKSVPKLLENPILVIESKSHKSRILLFGEIYDKYDVPIMAILELASTPYKGSKSLYLDNITIVNSYAKNNSEHPELMTTTRNYIANTPVNRFLYIDPDKNRTDTWLSLTGLQLPVGITKYGSLGSVTYPADYVKENIKKSNSLPLKEPPAGEVTSDAPKAEYFKTQTNPLTFRRGEADVEYGRTFQFEDNSQPSKVKDAYNQSLHLSDSVIVSTGYNYSAGRILSFNADGTVKVAIDSSLDIERKNYNVDPKQLLFVAHNDAKTVSENYNGDYNLYYNKLKETFENYFETGIINESDFEMPELQYCLNSLTHKRNMLTARLNNIFKERIDRGVATEAKESGFEVYSDEFEKDTAFASLPDEKKDEQSPVFNYGRLSEQSKV